MLPVLLEVLLVGRHQLGLALDDQQVFRVALLGGLREVEAAGYDRRFVDQDDLVMGDSVLVVDEDLDARVGNERGQPRSTSPFPDSCPGRPSPLRHACGRRPGPW